jgi:hypothetical protein
MLNAKCCAAAGKRRAVLRQRWVEVGPCDGSGLDAVNLVGHRRQLPLRHWPVGADGDNGNAGPLPEVVMLDL